MGDYYVYITANQGKVLYTGVTNNLVRRLYEHQQKIIPAFANKYNTTTLVYFEATNDVNSAIAREKQNKRLLRKKKIGLIESMNPEWRDLSEGWYEAGVDPSLRSG